MGKVMSFGEEAREKLQKGCKIMYDAVGTTYSPAGRNVVIGRQWGAPKIIHDGVGVAREVEVEDELVQLGIDLIKEAAQSQVAATGDGTTLTTILAHHIVDKGMTLIKENPDVNAMRLRKQILAAVPLLVAEIKKIAKPIAGDQIKDVTLISSDDEEIAEAVTDAIKKVGKDGLVTVELNKRQKIEVEYTEGLELDRGYGQNSVFVTDPERMTGVIENASVLLLNRKVTLQAEIMPLIEVVNAQGSKNLFIIGDVGGDALKTIAMLKWGGNFNILLIPPPGYGEARKDTFDDIALVTGATVIDDQIGMSKDQFIATFKKEWVGSTKKVIASKGTTNIIKYEPEDFKDELAKKQITERNKSVKDRVATLKRQLEETDSTYDKEKLQQRLARLTTGVAVVKVGSKNEIETNEKLERVKDAVPAAQAASQEGIVPGGGVTFLQLLKVFEGRVLNDGEKLLFEVLQEPIKKILINAGEETKKQDAIIAEIKEKGGNFGYNVTSEKVEDLMKSGVIDPAKVLRESLENSTRVATSIITGECLIGIKRQPEANMQMA